MATRLALLEQQQHALIENLQDAHRAFRGMAARVAALEQQLGREPLTQPPVC
jgi:hypothetical protein